MSWWRRADGNSPDGVRAGQPTIREYLESGNWGAENTRNHYRNVHDPRFKAAQDDHQAALEQLDALLDVVAAQQHLLDVLISLGHETDGGFWRP